ncbi:replication-relaxation family protein [Domibacillus indicus]|uniref:replication-relaxation family protein n=1 Tax=Domibacillus indicus TaxID=1437523 RepID=UPI00203D9139|nr:replication-relaxation family protein [Domibacillus indicus]MCM3786900.1 replication-relaxation family protein [Domibacillus indicus]
MDRDSVAAIYFSHVKDPIQATNATLLRLYRQDLIERTTDYQPFVYFPANSSMKKNSQKIPHYLELVKVYIDLLAYEQPDIFRTEIQYQKGLAQPDIFTVFKKSPLFIEVQRSTYSEKLMKEKIARYEALYDSHLLDSEPWQPQGKSPVFPAVLLLTTKKYAIKSDRFAVIQAESIDEFMRIMGARTVPTATGKPRKAPVITIKNNRGV